MTRRRVVASILLATGVAACGDSIDNPTGAEEPIYFKYALNDTVRAATFFRGEIPVANGPSIAGVLTNASAVAQGTTGFKLTVNVKSPAAAVAGRLRGKGSGYWTWPVDLEDPFAAGELNSHPVIDFSSSLEPGTYAFEFAGVDPDGVFGPLSFPQPIGVVRRFPNQFDSRDGSAAPMAPAVISLRWDNRVDIDLQILAPDGTFLDPKRPTTAPRRVVDGGPTSGFGNRNADSMAYCVDDGWRQEDVTFQQPPAPGRYVVYANMFDSCGQLGTTYELTVYVDGNVTASAQGRVSEGESLGGFRVGDHVMDLDF